MPNVFQSRGFVGRAMAGLLAAWILGVVAAPTALAQPVGVADGGVAAREIASLDALLEQVLARHDVPALGAAVVDTEGLVAIGAVGVRARGSDEAVRIDDLWHIGSNTKAMTATLCALLVERGDLRWEMTLAEAFPDLAEGMDEGYRRTTLEQLCTNRGGCPTSLDEGGLWGRLWRHDGTPTEARRLLLEELTSRPPAAEPGTTFIYSNAGFAIAGHVCESVTGTPYETLIRELLFEPLGMESVGFGAPGTPGEIDQPRGHDRRGRAQHPTDDGRGADNPPAITPAGRVHLSLEDWARYVRVQLGGAGGEAQQIGDVTLSPETLGRVFTPPGTGDHGDGYAMGWMRVERPWAGPEGDRWTYTHNGSNTMWFSVAWIAPARDFAVIVCCNQGEGGAAATDAAAAAIIREFLGGR
ncbi:MAG: beta-lactamase family protein [Phycisphaerales bacterium]|nr:beta-lactamase family protein [Phycisphaerales bacterium]MCB9840605.1 beta-lactamase family protein [Phycisphaeraceae bacterium]